MRLTHLPTGVVVQCQSERSQHQNRDRAYKQLRAKLHELELSKRRAQQQAIEDAKADIGWGSQIRSYVLDQSRVKDLRTEVERFDPGNVLDGDLDDIHGSGFEGGAMSTPGGETDVLGHRRRKLAALRERGEAYPNGFRRQHLARGSACRYGAATKEALAETAVPAVVAGRVMLRRVMGKASFLTLEEPKWPYPVLSARRRRWRRRLSRLQDPVGHRRCGGCRRHVDEDQQGRTDRARASHPPARQVVAAAAGEIPRPHRSGDAVPPTVLGTLMVNDESREVFRVRARLIAAMRAFFDERGFLEVETPMMHPIPGGATARPFVTHHNALDMGLVPASSAGAVPETTGGLAVSNGSTRSIAASATKACRRGTTPNSPRWSSTRRLPTIGI